MKKELMTDEEIKAYALQCAIEDVFSSRDKLDEEGDETGEEYTDEELLAMLKEGGKEFIISTDLYLLVYDAHEHGTCEMALDTIMGGASEIERLIKLGRDGKEEN